MATLLARVFLLLVAGWIVWILWRSARPRPAFVVRVEDGEPRPESGTVTAAFLQEVREILARHGVRTARILGQARGGRIGLVFSREIPPAACQQLRNYWALAGWNAGRAKR